MAARRAIFRWALRTVRKEWRQQFQNLLLLSVAVAGVTMILFVFDSQPQEPVEDVTELSIYSSEEESQVGTAGLSTIDAEAQVARAEQAGVEIFAKVPTVSLPAATLTGQLEVFELVETLNYQPLETTMIEGAEPTKATELALTAKALEQLDVTVGQEVTFGENNPETFKVVGIAEYPSDLSRVAGLVAPNTLASPDVRVAYSMESNFTAGEPLPVEIVDYRGEGLLDSLLAAVIVLIQVALLSSVGFLIVARRRMRQFGLLSAVGATDRQVRRVLFYNGLLIGVAGGTLGLAAGTALGVIVHRFAPGFVGHRLGMNWQVLVPALIWLLAVASSLAGSWWPAHKIEKLSTVQALNGRTEPPKQPRRLTVVAIVTAPISAAACYFMVEDPFDIFGVYRDYYAAVALFVAIVALLFLAPATVVFVASAGRRLSSSANIAGRDLQRHRSRSSVAVAGLVITLGLPISLILLNASTDAQGSPTVPGNAIILREDFESGESSPTVSDSDARLLAEKVNSAEVLELQTLVDDNGDKIFLAPSNAAGDHRRLDMEGQWVTIASPALLKLFDLDPAEASKLQAIVVNGEEPTLQADGGKLSLITKDGQSKALEGAEVSFVDRQNPFYGQPMVWVTPSLVGELGWETQTTELYVVASDPFTEGQLITARQALASLGYSPFDADFPMIPDSSSEMRILAFVVAGLAAAIVLLITSLIHSEQISDRRTLEAIGASSGTVRRVGSVAALLVSAGGLLLGTAFGILLWGLWAFDSETALPLVLPWFELLLLYVGFPLFAGLFGWLLSFSAGPSTRRPIF